VRCRRLAVAGVEACDLDLEPADGLLLLPDSRRACRGRDRPGDARHDERDEGAPPSTMLREGCLGGVHETSEPGLRPADPRPRGTVPRPPPPENGAGVAGRL